MQSTIPIQVEQNAHFRQVTMVRHRHTKTHTLPIPVESNADLAAREVKPAWRGHKKLYAVHNTHSGRTKCASKTDHNGMDGMTTRKSTQYPFRLKIILIINKRGQNGLAPP